MRMFAAVFVAAAEFRTVNATLPEPGAICVIDKIVFAVAHETLAIITLLDVTSEFVSVRVPKDTALITSEKLTWPALTEFVTGEAPATLVPTTFGPLAAVEATKSPLVAVILPEVAVTVVVAVTDPGAVIAEGRDSVRVDPEAAVVIWFAVPATVITPALGSALPVSPLI